MTDLFGKPSSVPSVRKAGPALQLTDPALITADPPVKPTKSETGPRFGTPEWDRCPCGGWAILHFPSAGGIRRCLRHAIAEGRFEPTPFPRWGFKASDAAGSGAGDTTRGLA